MRPCPECVEYSSVCLVIYLDEFVTCIVLMCAAIILCFTYSIMLVRVLCDCYLHCAGCLQWVVQGPVDVDIGANPSAEGGEDEGVDDTAVKVVDIVDTFRLQVAPLQCVWS